MKSENIGQICEDTVQRGERDMPNDQVCKN